MAMSEASLGGEDDSPCTPALPPVERHRLVEKCCTKARSVLRRPDRLAELPGIAGHCIYLKKVPESMLPWREATLPRSISAVRAIGSSMYSLNQLIP